LVIVKLNKYLHSQKKYGFLSLFLRFLYLNRKKTKKLSKKSTI